MNPDAANAKLKEKCTLLPETGEEVAVNGNVCLARLIT